MNPYQKDSSLQQQSSLSSSSQQFISQEQHHEFSSQQRIIRTTEQHSVSRQITQERGQFAKCDNDNDLENSQLIFYSKI